MTFQTLLILNDQNEAKTFNLVYIAPVFKCFINNNIICTTQRNINLLVH